MLNSDYKSELEQIAFNALELLEITSPDDFQNAIIADGELNLLEWDAQNPDMQVQVQVLDADTKRLKSGFRSYLESVIESGNSTDTR